MDLFWRRFVTVLVITTYIIFAVPMLFISGATTFTNTYNGMNMSLYSCSPANHQYPTFQFVFYLDMLAVGFANLVVTIGMYTPIMCAIYRHFQNSNLNQKPTDDPYTMIIQGKGKDDAEVPSQTAKEEAAKDACTRNRVRRGRSSSKLLRWNTNSLWKCKSVHCKRSKEDKNTYNKF